ncbi:MAG: GTP-binding protein, partial [Candidatus Onthomonas sp.]
DEDECGHEHHHHHDHDEDEEHGHHHHHDHDEDEEHGHHHHHDHDEDEEHGHHHHHDHDEDEEHEHHHHDHEGCCGHDHHHHHHHADEVFTSWGMETPKKFTQAEIRTALEALDTGDFGQILRAKGIVPNADGSWIHFDYVPGEVDVRSGAADVTGRLCVIGAQLKEQDLKALFHL